MRKREKRRIAVALLAAAAAAALATAAYFSSRPWTPVLIGVGMGAWIGAFLLLARSQH